MIGASPIFNATHVHKKTGSRYKLICIAVDSETLEHCTVYQGADGVYWVRPTAEFDDGRFEPIDDTDPSLPGRVMELLAQYEAMLEHRLGTAAIQELREKRVLLLRESIRNASSRTSARDSEPEQRE